MGSDEECTIWEAASATAAAPVYFQHVTMASGAALADVCVSGNNNPVFQAMAETKHEPSFEDRKIGCVLSIGTGLLRVHKLSDSITGFMAQAASMLTNAETITNRFEASSEGGDLLATNRYFRFNVIQGMDEVGLDECQTKNEMKEFADYYLSIAHQKKQVIEWVKGLSNPDKIVRRMKKSIQPLMPDNNCLHFVSRPELERKVIQYFKSDLIQQQVFVLYGLGGISKTQLALKIARSLLSTLRAFWIRCDHFQNFSEDFRKLWRVLSQDEES